MKSLIIPVYKNEENINDLLNLLKKWHEKSPFDIEVVFVIDGSPDKSGTLLSLAQKEMPYSSQIIYHSRNFGSFAAIRTGLENATGDHVAVMAADMQEPIALVDEIFKKLDADEADIIFGVREKRNDGFIKDKLSNMFWSFYRRFVVKDIPRGGVDIFGCNRQVINSILQLKESYSSLISQLFWIGFRRDFIEYERQKREKGKSAWNFSRRFYYMVDSVFSFSDLPIMLVLWIGFFGSIGSFLFGSIVLLARIFNLIHVPGYAAISVLIAFSTSLILLVQGIFGVYLFRCFENSKHRPLTIISHKITNNKANLK